MGCPFPFSFRVFVACCVALAPRSRCCFSLTCCLVTQSLATPLSSIFFFSELRRDQNSGYCHSLPTMPEAFCFGSFDSTPRVWIFQLPSQKCEPPTGQSTQEVRVLTPHRCSLFAT